MVIGSPFNAWVIVKGLFQFAWMHVQIRRQSAFNRIWKFGVNLNWFVVFTFQNRCQSLVRTDPNGCGFTNEFKQRSHAFQGHLSLNVWNNVEEIMRIDGNLCGSVKRSNGFYLIAKKFNSKRKIVGIRKHIDDSTTNGKLSRFVHKINTVKVIFQQQFIDKIDGIRFCYFNA